MAETPFPFLVQAMQQAGAMIQDHWQTTASRLLSTPGERQAYLQGFSGEAPVVTTTPSGLSTSVVNTSPIARRIERGTAAYHLPSRIDWGRTSAARRSHSGRYFIIVPFRHYSAQRASRLAQASPTARRNMLTRPVYTVASRLQRGQYLTAGPSQGRAVHAPGLRPYVPSFPRNIRPGYTHAALQERLIRSTGHRRGTSTYLTFRTMTEQSPGWWIPAKAPVEIMAATVRSVTPEVQRLLAAAATADVVAQIQVQIQPQGGA